MKFIYIKKEKCPDLEPKKLDNYNIYCTVSSKADAGLKET